MSSASDLTRIEFPPAAAHPAVDAHRVPALDSAPEGGRLNRLIQEVRSGTYHPRPDEVAERVTAWLTPAPVAHG